MDPSHIPSYIPHGSPPPTESKEEIPTEEKLSHEEHAKAAHAHIASVLEEEDHPIARQVKRARREAKKKRVKKIEKTGEAVEKANKPLLIAAKITKSLKKIFKIETNLSEEQIEQVVTGGELAETASLNISLAVNITQYVQIKGELKDESISDSERQELLKKKKATEKMCKKLLKKSSLDTIHKAGLVVQEVFRENAEVFSIAGEVGSSSFAILKLFKAKDSWEKLNKTTEESVNIELEMEKIKEQRQQNPSPFMQKLLELREKNLIHQKEARAVESSKHAISVVSGLLSGCLTTVKVILLIAGITLGTSLSLGLSATGLGAVALAGMGLIIGASYFLYKKRHAISHAMRKITLAPKLYSAGKQLETETKKLTELENKFDKILHQQNRMLNQFLSEIERIGSHQDSFLHMADFSLEEEQKNLEQTDQRLSYLERLASLKKRHIKVIEAHTLKTLTPIRDRIREISQKREAMLDEISERKRNRKYRRILYQFPGIQSPKELKEKIASLNVEENLEELQAFAEAHEITDPIPERNVTNYLIRLLTAPPIHPHFV